jgi:peptide chain release factor subunit 1
MSCTKISLYIPPKRPLSDVIAQLKHERGIASNIKDPETRQKLSYTLSHLIAYLLEQKETPTNGLIIFADSEDCKVIAPVNDTVGANAYRCDDHYYEPQRRIEGLVP